ncbi:MAG: heavy-metal-associated domain-containing protein [Novosphingobium sp.]
MAIAILSQRARSYRPGPAAQLFLGLAFLFALALAVIGPDRLIAQIEGDRGIPPVAASSDIHIGGIEVETTGKTAEEARMAGWREAQRKGWLLLKGPSMSESQIESMVLAIVIEHEQIGPHRYVAKLGVVFDRQRAGGLLNQGGRPASHSAPLLVLPVLYSGGAEQVFEVRTPWQRAWANYSNGASAIDYVRPIGSGGDSLLLTAGQAGRRSRGWWRTVLDQFSASDVLIPVARLERQWPGGPVRGTFTARYGPDSTFLESFTLTANDEAGVPGMLDQAVERMDKIYGDALSRGLLKPDPTLVSQTQSIDAALAAIEAANRPKDDSDSAARPGEDGPSPAASAAVAPQAASSFVVQFNSPDAQAVDSALGSVRGASGVRGASTTSIAIGGTSVMRVTYGGSLEELAAALRARGWSVTVGSNALSIRR